MEYLKEGPDLHHHETRARRAPARPFASRRTDHARACRGARSPAVLVGRHAPASCRARQCASALRRLEISSRRGRAKPTRRAPLDDAARPSLPGVAQRSLNLDHGDMAEDREQGGWRPWITKKPGRTVCCGELVSVGSRVEWHPAKGIRHVPGECGHGMQSLAPTPPAPDREQPVASDRDVLPTGERLIPARRASTCRVCGEHIDPGAPIWWKPGESRARHGGCPVAN